MQFTQIDDLRAVVNEAIKQALEPITTRRQELQTAMENEIIKRDSIDSKRDAMITKLAQGESDIKPITRTRNDYEISDDEVKIYAEAISRLSQSLGEFTPIKNKMETVVRSSVAILELKKKRAQLEVSGQATNIQDKHIRAEHGSFMKTTTDLFDSMQAVGIDNAATGKALVKLTEALLEFMPVVTNATPVKANKADLDDGYLPPITNVNQQKEAAA